MSVDEVLERIQDFLLDVADFLDWLVFGWWMDRKDR